MALRFRDFCGLLGFLVVCLSVAGIGGAVTRTSVNDWYQALNKSAFTPPDWIFAPVWTALYVLMAISAWLVWRRAKRSQLLYLMTAFGIQLALNLAWSFIFFGAKSVGWALVELAFLWMAIVITQRVFWNFDRTAGALLTPYIAWVSYAAFLNASIYWLN